MDYLVFFNFVISLAVRYQAFGERLGSESFVWRFEKNDFFASRII